MEQTIKNQLNEIRERGIKVYEFERFDFEKEKEQFEIDVDFFNMLSDGRLTGSEKSLMHRVYINGDSIVGASGEMNISVQYAYMLHASAIKKLQRAFDSI